jgi:hypothetical protein
MTKSCTRTSSGEPLGRHSRPPFLKSPTSYFFLVSTEIGGSPEASASVTVKLWQHTRGFVPVADGGNGSADKEKNRATAGGAATPDLLEATREGNAP